MTTMKAIRIHGYGNPDGLTHEESPHPNVGDDDVLIRVHATSVNPFDCAARAGYMAGYYQYAFPHILGLDVSGVVESVGKAVTDFAPGDSVYARPDPSRNGAYAEYCAVSAADVAMKPKSLDYVQAAAVPHVALTAWRALIDTANLSKGQTILIHGAAGGVGSMAVQFAKWRGAKVIGTASTSNLDFLKSLGVDQVVDYQTTRFEDVAHDVDAVFDTVGGETQERSWGVLKTGGILMSIVQPPSADTAAARGVRQQFVGGFGPAGKVLADIAALIDSGEVKPIISTTLPLHEIQKAHTMSQSRHTRGKIVLQVVI